MVTQTKGEAKVSDKAKGLLKQIHEHHTGLSMAVKNKNLEAAHEHADSIQELCDELTSEVAQDHKTGVEKLITSINEVHDAAEGGNQSATEANLRKLDEALKELKTRFQAETKAEAKVSDKAKSILKQIHEHHAELSTAVKKKNLESAHEHADSIQENCDGLMSEVGPEHKAGVESLVAAVNEVHDAAEAGNQSTTEASLKKLDSVLKEVDAQFGIGKKEKAKISSKAQGILKQIHQHHSELSAAVKSKNLESAHEHVDTIQELTEDLASEVGQPHKAVMDELASILEQLHDAADEGKLTATETNLKKFEEALKDLDARFAN